MQVQVVGSFAIVQPTTTTKRNLYYLVEGLEIDTSRASGVMIAAHGGALIGRAEENTQDLMPR